MYKTGARINAVLKRTMYWFPEINKIDQILSKRIRGGKKEKKIPISGMREVASLTIFSTDYKVQ